MLHLNLCKENKQAFQKQKYWYTLIDLISYFHFLNEKSEDRKELDQDRGEYIDDCLSTMQDESGVEGLSNHSFHDKVMEKFRSVLSLRFE